MHKVYHESRNDEQQEDGCHEIVLIILNYLLYCGTHLFGISYYYTYVIYEDALENPEYNNKEITLDMNPENYIAVVVACVILLYSQQIYFSIKFTRHCLGVCMTTQLCTLLYVYGRFTKMLTTSCENRQFLTCHKNATHIPLNDEVLKDHADNIEICVLTVFATQTLYIVGSVMNNYNKRYFFSRKIWKEFPMYYLYYVTITCIIFILPMILFVAMITGIGGDGGDGSCNCNLDFSGCRETITGNEPKPDSTARAAPFGTIAVSQYDKGRRKDDLV